MQGGGYGYGYGGGGGGGGGGYPPPQQQNYGGGGGYAPAYGGAPPGAVPYGAAPPQGAPYGPGAPYGAQPPQAYGNGGGGQAAPYSHSAPPYTHNAAPYAAGGAPAYGGGGAQGYGGGGAYGGGGGYGGGGYGGGGYGGGGYGGGGYGGGGYGGGGGGAPATVYLDAQGNAITQAQADGDPEESGLRELLRVAATETVRTVGHEGGYWNNAAIRLPLPSSLKKIASLLRKLGMENVVQSLEVALNRAAEAAALKALPIFEAFIRGLHLRDVKHMLVGSKQDRASPATDLFRQRTEADLARAYAPVVEQSMAECGVAQIYSSVGRAVEHVPIIGGRSLPDLLQYTVKKALDGLFLVLAEQEAKIRRNPAKQASSLIKLILR